jgi:uncharacterized protein YggE
MIRRVLVGAAALSLMAVASARAQGLDDITAVLATGEEQIGQSVGEAALGGSSVYVTARGTAKLPAALAKTYAVTVEGEAPTAVAAAQVRDAKLDKLRAAARRFGVEMTVDDAGYNFGARAAARPFVLPTPGVPAPPPAPAKPVFTTTAGVRFTRPSEAQMPAFLDAVHEAGVETFASTTAAPNPFAQAGQLFGFGPAAPNVDPAVWEKASAAAVEAARRQAQVLAAAGGRKLGPLRQVMLLTRTIHGDAVAVSVGARFSFAE